MMTEAEMGAVCRPNIGKAGRRRRTRVGIVAALVGVVLAVVLIALHAPWQARLSLFLPAAAAAVTLLQVRRNT